jgi:hypothetical protein
VAIGSRIIHETQFLLFGPKAFRSVRSKSEVATNEKCRMNKANGFKMNSPKKRGKKRS